MASGRLRERGRRGVRPFALGLSLALAPHVSRAQSPWVHDDVRGPAVDRVEVTGGERPERVAFVDLSTRPARGRRVLAFEASGDALSVPLCAGFVSLAIDEKPVPLPAGFGVVPLAGRGPHAVALTLDVSKYEARVACASAPRAGSKDRTARGLFEMSFASPAASRGGGRALVYLPQRVAEAGALPVLVGLHPWNGSPRTYAAYRELTEAAEQEGVVLLFPSGLGNSLYTAEAEREVHRAEDALARALPMDRARVSLWGASMGGAGATTIAFHKPDRYAFVASFFGDSRYDRATYVKAILKSDAEAHAVNALDVVAGARHLPVLLVHGESDRVSPIAQSTMLADAMRTYGYSVELRRAPGRGHEARLVVEHVRDVVARAAVSRAPRRPSRVTIHAARREDCEGYGVTVEPQGPGDVLLDVEARDGRVLVHRAANVARVTLEPGALGLAEGAPLLSSSPPVVWKRKPEGAPR